MKIVNCKLNYFSSSGQVAIIVLLVSAVMLTLGLSMSKNETVEIKINANDESLKKAFDAAESGINFYLETGGTSYSSPGNNSVAQINATKIGVGSSINFEEFVLAGSNESYWLVNHLDNGDIGATYFTGPDIDICGVGFTGSMEVSLFYNDGAYKVERGGYNFGAKKVNDFDDVSGNCATVELGMIGNPILISIMPIFGGGKFYVQAASGSFSSQGMNIVSEGKIETQVRTKLSIRQRYKMPGFMVSGMMAEGKIRSE